MAIWLGSSIFGFIWILNIADSELQNCEFPEDYYISVADYAEVNDLLTDYGSTFSCLDSIKRIEWIRDTDHDGKISRCESAQFLYAYNNDIEYARKYSSTSMIEGLE